MTIPTAIGEWHGAHWRRCSSWGTAATGWSRRSGRGPRRWPLCSLLEISSVDSEHLWVFSERAKFIEAEQVNEIRVYDPSGFVLSRLEGVAGREVAVCHPEAAVVLQHGEQKLLVILVRARLKSTAAKSDEKPWFDSVVVFRLN